MMVLQRIDAFYIRLCFTDSRQSYEFANRMTTELRGWILARDLAYFVFIVFAYQIKQLPVILAGSL
jgi:hypothetical protein